MNVNELLEKCRALLAENHSLREENEILKGQLGITDPPRPDPPQGLKDHRPLAYAVPELPDKNPQPKVKPTKTRMFINRAEGQNFEEFKEFCIKRFKDAGLIKE